MKSHQLALSQQTQRLIVSTSIQLFGTGQVRFSRSPQAKVYLVYHGHTTLTFVSSVRHNIRGKTGEIRSIAHAQLQMKLFFPSARLVTSVTVVVDRFIQQIKEARNSSKPIQTFRSS